MFVATKARDDVAELAVIDIERPGPGNEAGTDLELPVEDRGIDHSRQQVVRCLDGVNVAGEMQVDLLHRDDLGHAAPGAATLDAEERPRRRLPQAEGDVGSNSSEPLRQADRARRLSLPRPGRGDRGDDDQTTVRPALEAFQGIEADLRLVRSVGDQLRLPQPELLADLHDRAEAALLGDVERPGGLAHGCSGFISFVRGLAASSSLTTAVATSSA